MPFKGAPLSHYGTFATGIFHPPTKMREKKSDLSAMSLKLNDLQLSE